MLYKNYDIQTTGSPKQRFQPFIRTYQYQMNETMFEMHNKETRNIRSNNGNSNKKQLKEYFNYQTLFGY